MAFFRTKLDSLAVTQVRCLKPFAFCLAVVLVSPAAWAGPSSPDLVVSAKINSTGNAFVGGDLEAEVKIQNQGTAATSHSPGDTVLRVDLSPLVDYDPITAYSVAGGANLNCSIVAAVLTCQVTSQVFLAGGRNTFDLTGHYNGVGDWTMPAIGGECQVDPDNLIDEADESNNDCSVDWPLVTVAPAPTMNVDRVLGVSMWTNLAYIYDRNENNFVNAIPYSESDGTPLHALDDIVKDPVSGKLYVFQRRYQSNKHRLGIFNPVSGVEDIGDTGVSFHDSTFATDGTLYAVGRDATLYSVNTETAAVTALCDTGYGSSNSTHSALAWDPVAEELLQVIDRQLLTIDVSSLPVSSTDPCPSTAVAMDTRVRGGMFAAEYVGGNLLVLRESESVYIVGRNGAVLKYGDGVPTAMHGLVEDPGTLPVAAPPCPADALVSFTNDADDSSLFAVNLEDGELTYVKTFPFIIQAMDLDPVNGQLIVADNQQELYRIDACTGEVDSQLTRPNGPGRFSELSIPRSGLAHAINLPPEFYSLDLASGSSSSLGIGPSAYSMTVVDDEVLHETPHSDESTSISFYSLASYPALNSSLPLVYEPGLEAGKYRRIIGLDSRFRDNALFGVLQRVDDSGGANLTNALGNVLVRIDESGNVTHVADLPAGARNVTIDNDLVFANGFESPELP